MDWQIQAMLELHVWGSAGPKLWQSSNLLHQTLFQCPNWAASCKSLRPEFSLQVSMWRGKLTGEARTVCSHLYFLNNFGQAGWCSGSALDLYWRCMWFKFCLGYQLSWLKFFVVLLSLGECWDNKWATVTCLPIHYSWLACHLIHCYVTSAVIT